MDDLTRQGRIKVVPERRADAAPARALEGVLNHLVDSAPVRGPFEHIPNSALQEKARLIQAHIDAELIRIGIPAAILNAPLVTLNLPMPPSIDNYFVPVPMKNGKARFILGKEGKAYRKEVWWHVAQKVSPELRPLCGRLDLYGILHFTTAAGDVDNRSKCLLDSLQWADLYKNDSAFDIVKFERGEKHRPARVIVKIYAHRDPPPPYPIQDGA